MAAGSQEEKGICALLVIPVIKIANISVVGRFELLNPKTNMFQVPSSSLSPIHNKIPASPIRLVSAVSIPAEKDLFL